MNRRDRLKIFIRHLISAKIIKSQKDLGVRLGYDNESYFSQIINGHTSEPTDFIYKLKSLEPLLNIDWLENGRGNMLKSDTSSIIGDITITGGNNNNIGHRQQNFPTLFEAKTAEVECPKCGELIIVKNPAVLKMIPKEITRKPNINLEQWRKNHPQQMKKIDFSQIWGEEPFVVQVDTRAMEPDYREGTFLVLQPLPDISYATADGIAYVVDTMKPHTLFRNLTDKYDGSYVLTANNDKRSYIRLKAEDIITVYDIVGSFRIGR